MGAIRNLPWKLIRKSGYTLRRLVATKDKPQREHLLVDAPIEALQKELRINNFRSGWFLSWHFKGEDGNLCRAEYKHGDLNELQLHIRLYDREDDRTELHAHVEMCPVEHPRKHLNGKMHSTGKGIMMTKGILDKNNLAYEHIKFDGEE